MPSLAPAPYQEFDDNGNVLAGGAIYFYEDGTTTLKAIYNDADGDVPAANPLVLDASGRGDVFLASGYYKIVCKDSVGNAIWQLDKIIGSGGDATIVTTVENLAELTALDPPDEDGVAVYVGGYNAKSDGGGGMFVWDATNTDPKDYGTIFIPDFPSGAGR